MLPGNPFPRLLRHLRCETPALYEPERTSRLRGRLAVLTLFPALGRGALSQAKCEAVPSIFVPCRFRQWDPVWGSPAGVEGLFLVRSQRRRLQDNKWSVAGDPGEGEGSGACA